MLDSSSKVAAVSSHSAMTGDRQKSTRSGRSMNAEHGGTAA